MADLIERARIVSARPYTIYGVCDCVSLFFTIFGFVSVLCRSSKVFALGRAVCQCAPHIHYNEHHTLLCEVPFNVVVCICVCECVGAHALEGSHKFWYD